MLQLLSAAKDFDDVTDEGATNLDRDDAGHRTKELPIWIVMMQATRRRCYQSGS